jgi:pseudouridine-5'-phosphate glycosidase
MIVAVPNPAPSDDIEEAIQEALRSAAAEEVSGAQVTPYVLAMVKELTGTGQVLRAPQDTYPVLA